MLSLSIKRPISTRVSKVPSDTSLKNYQKQSNMHHSYSQSSFSDKVHHLFEKIVIENTLRNDLFVNVHNNRYNYIRKLFDKEILHSERIPDINSKFKEGNTVLHIAVSNTKYNMCELLLDLGADIEAQNSKGRTPLHIAVLNSNKALTDLLLSYDADINCVDNKQYTPLFYATILGNKEIIEMLLLHNADISLKNIYNETCFDVISKRDIMDVFAMYCSEEEIRKNRSRYRRTYIRNSNRKDMYLEMGYKLKKYCELMRNSNLYNRVQNIINNNDDMYCLLPNRLQLNNFYIEDLLGKGGFGEVYLVQLKKTDNIYALKAIDKKRVLKESVRKYVENERRVYEKFHNPFIVKFYRAFQSELYLYLLIEYMPNGDLKGYIKKYKTFSEKDVRIVSAQVILALEHLHKQGIIYRDLKPENILIDKEGYIKLADFGLCKEGTFDNYSSTSFCGSIAYLPPELINRTGHGRAADWYLLGTVIYEMLIGFPPYFTKMGREQLVDNIKNGQLKFYNKNLSNESVSLIKGLLERKIEKRLGASLRDSQEIKEHPFYKGLNFEAVYNKEFVPPVQFRGKPRKNSSLKKRDESKWYCNKDLKNDMKSNENGGVAKKDNNYIKTWDFDGIFKEGHNKN